MNLIETFSQFNYIQITTFFLVFIGVILLITSINIVRKFSKILNVNEYDTKQWIIIVLLIFFFVVGYSVHAFDVFDFFEFPLDPILMVSLIYFFGAVFVVLAMRSTYSLVKSILGEVITNREAYEIFLKRVGKKDEELEHLYDDFEINCDSCNKKIVYSIADVVRQNYNLSDKGVNVQVTFGVHSFLLRPSHKCKGGRREVVVAHDQTLAYRSVDQSRIILGSSI